jgi:hypothetical protein
VPGLEYRVSFKVPVCKGMSLKRHGANNPRYKLGVSPVDRCCTKSSDLQRQMIFPCLHLSSSEDQIHRCHTRRYFDIEDTSLWTGQGDVVSSLEDLCVTDRILPF